MANQGELLIDAGYTEEDWLVPPSASSSDRPLPYATASGMMGDVIIIARPAPSRSRAWAAIRWTGLFLLEILLVPVSGRRPPQWSVIRPLAERLVLWWDRRIAKR